MSIDLVKIEYKVNASVEDIRDDEFVRSIVLLDEWNNWRNDLTKKKCLMRGEHVVVIDKQTM